MEGLYYTCIRSENKGADQLRSYCAADLRFWFRICKKSILSQRGSFKLIDFTIQCLFHFVKLSLFSSLVLFVF